MPMYCYISTNIRQGIPGVLRSVPESVNYSVDNHEHSKTDYGMVSQKSLLIKEGHGGGGELMVEGQIRINYLSVFIRI